MTSKVQSKLFSIVTYLLLPLLFVSSVKADQTTRLVVLAPDLAQNLIALGAAAQIEGIIANPRLEQQLPGAEVVGDHQLLNIEKILSIKPDWVIAWQGGNPESQLRRLESLGVRLLRVKTERLEDFPAQLELYGELLGRQAEAEELIQQFLSEIERYEVKTGAEVRLFYELWHSPLMTLNDSSWIAEIFTLCGATNALGNAIEAYPQVSDEAVLAEDIDLILGSSELPKNWHEKWRKWPQIPAVAADQIYTVNADYLHQLTLDTVKGVEQVCQAVEQARRFR